MKIDKEVSKVVQEHIAENGIGPGELIFPGRLFASRVVMARRTRMSEEEIKALGWTEPLPNGRRYTAPWAPTLRPTAAATDAASGVRAVAVISSVVGSDSLDKGHVPESLGS